MRLHRAHGVVALRKLVAATAVSSFGDGLVAVAFPLLALRLGASPFAVGALAATTRLPWLVVALPAGLLVDRVDRRRLVLLVDLLRAVAVGLVAAAVAVHRAWLMDLFAAAFLLGTGETIVHAASQAIVPRAASGDEMVAANGRIGAAQTAALQFGGPAAGGALFGLSRALPFAGDAVSYLGSAVLLWGAVGDAGRTRASAELDRAQQGARRPSLRSGLGYFVHSAPLRTLATTIGAFAFCQAAVLGVLVVYATRVLHLGASGYGVLLALAALGDVAGSLMAARIHATLGPRGTVLAAGLAAAAGYVVLGATTNRYLALVGLLLDAIGSSVTNVAAITARLRIIPSDRFGVVNNAYRMFVYGVAPFGALAGGTLAVAYGTRPTFVLAGSLMGLAILLLASPLRSLAPSPVPDLRPPGAPEPSH